MKKITIYIVMATLCLNFNAIAQVATLNLKGKIIDENGMAVPGINLSIKDTKIHTITDKEGFFALKNVQAGSALKISGTGYKTKLLTIIQNWDLQLITIQSDNTRLNEVEIVSTGYQNIPKERATGSFVLLDSTLLNRKVSTNIVDRLDGVTSGLIFNKNKQSSNTSDISIRGRSTIASNADPLIILDNFPYDGDLSNINPQDVKSINILKDGAAASIWGSRAGNGVIVITTYKGAFNQKPIIGFSSNFSIENKPDLFYMPQLTNKEFIGVEQFLFDKGAYNNIIDNGYGALSPAVEVMLLNRNGTIDFSKKGKMLDSLSNHDNRNDLLDYYYRRSVKQQYQLNVNGGGESNKYYISAGYDKNLGNIVTNSNDRITLNINNTINLFNNKVELHTGILFSNSKGKTTGGGYQQRYPYERIADQNGKALNVTDGTLRLPFVDSVGNGKLLNWHYQPLEEIRNNLSSTRLNITDYRINLGISYKILPIVKVSLNYTYNKGITEDNQFYSLESYYTRNLINSFTQLPSTGTIIYPIPLGGIATNNTNSYFSHYGRAQLSFDKTFKNIHLISAIAGVELKDYESSLSSLNLYGFNSETATNGNSTINPTIFYPYIYGYNSQRINLNINNVGTIDRYRSYFANASYTLNNKYILSLSARRDESNLFGVKSNQKGVPLWSMGLAWNLSKESFYDLAFLPYLKIRATYGYNGNVNKSISAYLTASSNGLLNPYGKQYLSIQNPPNPSLKWERVKNVNFGIDFGTKADILTGSIDYWIKDGLDLIGATPIAAQTGITLFTGNSANMRGHGIDLILNSKNLDINGFKWRSGFLLNYNTDKITSYKVKGVRNSDIVSSNFLQPLEGYSYYSLFSYKYMGLDGEGNPQSITDGKLSKDYSALNNSTNANDLLYSGSLSPKFYGNLLNTFSWKSLELSFNLTYKLGYVYRRTSLNNSSLFTNPNTTSAFQQPDFDLRWQKTGDEAITNVPSLIYPADGLRDNIYYYSSVLVEKADNIRLQDIKLNYMVSNKRLRFLPFSNINIYFYASNLGIVWRASKYKIDPDYPYSIPVPRIYSIGLKTNF